MGLSLVRLGAAPEAQPTINFDRDIRPILAENCYHCHGPDGNKRKAKLRLDEQSSLFKESISGYAVVAPGQPDLSELMLRILSDDSEEMMPPPDSHRSLTPRQKVLVRQWIEEGAPWTGHWAFTPPKRPPVPNENTLCPVDAFIRATLRQKGLAPSPEASRETLIRRVSLDLTGLPPTPAEVEAFRADASDGAYERLVDRLLASPRYGERMVWDWLDAARYADTNGFQGDGLRTAWPWRDWVIDAFNRNLPFDQFTIKQLAGDLLPKPTAADLIATAFNRNHPLNNEGGSIPEESRLGYVTDRVDTTATLWMGLTMACARCHDHKYDPVSQREYYQLAAYFNQVPETGNADTAPVANPVLSIATPEQEAKVAQLRVREAMAKLERDGVEAQLKTNQAEWEMATLASGWQVPEPAWTELKPEDAFAQKGGAATIEADNSVALRAASTDTDDLVWIGRLPHRRVTALRIEALPDPALPGGGPGRGSEGDFTLTEVRVQGDDKSLDLVVVGADSSAEGFPLVATLDRDSATGWSPKTGSRRHWAVFELTTPFDPLDDSTALTVRLEHRSSRPASVLGRFRVSVTDAPSISLKAPSSATWAALRQPAAARSAMVQREITDFYLGTNAGMVAVARKHAEAKRVADAAARDLPRVMIMKDEPGIRETHVLVRGAYDQPGEKVSPGVPAVLPPLPASAPGNRLAFAQWLVAPENPLTARVAVNRLWAMFFGSGLVRTPGDFGTQGDKPTHPELLDWLACEFRESGWDVKRFIRLLVTSATYRQSSRVTPALLEHDPANLYLARAPRYRWPSWMIRDQALADAGLLVEKVGGPPVKGYQPPGIWEEATFGKIKYQQEQGEALYRRSLYTFWRRIAAPPLYFDSADRQTCVVDTVRTNTPLQALTTLNDVTFVEASRALAERMLAAAPHDDASAVRHGFQIVTARQPTSHELAILECALARFQAKYAADTPAAAAFVGAGASRPKFSGPPARLAAFTAVANLLLNLDETLTKE